MSTKQISKEEVCEPRFLFSFSPLLSSAASTLSPLNMCIQNRLQLKKHNKKEDGWIAIRGKVYNVTQFFEYVRFRFPSFLLKFEGYKCASHHIACERQ